MDPSARGQDDRVEEETSADAGSSPKCSVTTRVRVVVVVVTVILLTGILLSQRLFAASEVNQTSRSPGKEMMEQLQQCQMERNDLDLMLRNVTQDSRCSLCPDDWLWWRGHCYFFSVGLQEDRRWRESAEFCQGHNSMLAVITDPAEMDFIQRAMKTFPRFPFLWVGLTDSEQEGRWLWWDRTDLRHHMPLMVEWDSDHRDCADLRGGGSLFAADCDAYGPWVCKRES